jgi:ATP adenylyltransferase
MGSRIYTSGVERLWTPWRKAFVEGGGDLTCFLCAKPAEEDDTQNYILYRAENVFVVLNRYPYNSGHLMVAPYAHTGDFAGLDASVATDLIHVTQRSVAILRRAYQPDAFNVGMNLGRTAGAGVPDHLHVHVVPRWNGDTNFMPVVGETKVMPESLDQTYDRLAPLFHSKR